MKHLQTCEEMMQVQKNVAGLIQGNTRNFYKILQLTCMRLFRIYNKHLILLHHINFQMDMCRPKGRRQLITIGLGMALPKQNGLLPY